MSNLPRNYSPQEPNKENVEDATYYDIETAYQKTKKGLGTATKVGVLGALGLGIGLQSLKKMVVGDPPSKLRQTLVYGSIAAAFAWHGCQDDIRPAAKNTYEYLYGEQSQRVEQLNEQLRAYETTTQEIARERDSLHNMTHVYEEEREEALTKAEQFERDLRLAAQQNTSEPTPETTYVVQEQNVDIEALREELQQIKESQNERRRMPQTTYVAPLTQPPNNVETHQINQETQYTRNETHQITQTDTIPQQRNGESCWYPLGPQKTLEDIAEELYGDPEEVHRITIYDNIQDEENLPAGMPLDLEDCPQKANTNPKPDYSRLTARGKHNMRGVMRRMDFRDEEYTYNAQLGNNLYDLEGYNIDVILYRKPE